MSDREAETLPPPDEFTEPHGAADTLPPPALVEALRIVVREEVERAVGVVAKQWGEAFVAEHEAGEETRRIAENGIAEGKQRERLTTDRFTAVYDLLRKVAAHVGVPDDHPLEEIDKLPSPTFNELHDVERKQRTRGGE